VEVVALEHARHRVLRRELDHVRPHGTHEPLGVEAHLGSFGIEHLEDLRLVGLRVREILSRVNGLRVTFLPVGSPIMPVKSPIRKMTWCPSSWNCASC
jgi:hypothetical protein